VSIFNLVLNGHVFIEGKLSGKRHVDDHPRRPHVQGAVEALLAKDVGIENFGGKVRRRSDDRFPERLFPDDPGIAEIAEFDLIDSVDNDVRAMTFLATF